MKKIFLLVIILIGLISLQAQEQEKPTTIIYEHAAMLNENGTNSFNALTVVVFNINQNNDIAVVNLSSNKLTIFKNPSGWSKVNPEVIDSPKWKKLPIYTAGVEFEGIQFIATVIGDKEIFFQTMYKGEPIIPFRFYND